MFATSAAVDALALLQVLIYMIADSSGGHINPAVSVGTSSSSLVYISAQPVTFL